LQHTKEVEPATQEKSLCSCNTREKVNLQHARKVDQYREGIPPFSYSSKSTTPHTEPFRSLWTICQRKEKFIIAPSKSQTLKWLEFSVKFSRGLCDLMGVTINEARKKPGCVSERSKVATRRKRLLHEKTFD
jgi:hypothetical protein